MVITVTETVNTGSCGNSWKLKYWWDTPSISLLILIGILQSCLLDTVSGEATIYPISTAGSDRHLLGSNVSLACKATDIKGSTVWQLNGNGMTIDCRIKSHDRIKLHGENCKKENGWFNLTIEGIQFEDRGKYQCTNGKSDSRRVHVAVPLNTSLDVKVAKERNYHNTTTVVDPNYLDMRPNSADETEITLVCTTGCAFPAPIVKWYGVYKDPKVEKTAIAAFREFVADGFPVSVPSSVRNIHALDDFKSVTETCGSPEPTKDPTQPPQDQQHPRLTDVLTRVTSRLTLKVKDVASSEAKQTIFCGAVQDLSAYGGKTVVQSGYKRVQYGDGTTVTPAPPTPTTSTAQPVVITPKSEKHVNEKFRKNLVRWGDIRGSWIRSGFSIQSARMGGVQSQPLSTLEIAGIAIGSAFILLLMILGYLCYRWSRSQEQCDDSDAKQKMQTDDPNA